MKQSYNEIQKSLNYENHCPFCAEEDNFIVTYSTNKTCYVKIARARYTPDHLLIIPVRCTRTIKDLTPAERDGIYELQCRADDVLRVKGYTGFFHFVRESETLGGQTGKTVHHLHYHVVPGLNMERENKDIYTRVLFSDDEYEQLTQEFIESISQ